MSVKIITKQTKPEGHVSPKRWMKYIARNLSVSESEQFTPISICTPAVPNYL